MKKPRPCCVVCDKAFGGGGARLPHGRICQPCKRHLAYHPQPCPCCRQIRPLAYPSAEGATVCAACAGEVSVFACATCGREDHPYGSRRCARCILAERLTTLLTDPATGRIHARLRPVFDTLISSDRPQTGIYWISRPPGDGPRLLGAMARGEIPISHSVFATLPGNRSHTYLRDLLVAVGVLDAYDPRLEQTTRWIADRLENADNPGQAEIVRRYARWHVLRQLRATAGKRPLSKGQGEGARERVNAALVFLDWAAARGHGPAEITQSDVDAYLARHPGRRSTAGGFISWMHTTRINTGLRTTHPTRPLPAVTTSDQQRWRHVEILLHDDAIKPYVRIAGLFMLLFAQPLARICHMRTSQIDTSARQTTVTFDAVPIEMPEPLAGLVRQQAEARGNASYASRGNGWLFPGGIPGRPLNTENIRGPLVALGIRPNASRRAALFQLAAQIPAPVLAELVGISQNNAARWAALAARDWATYISHRAAEQQPD